MASFCGKDEDRVFRSVKKSILGQFRHELRNQAMQHTRHRIKRLLERRVDGKFTNINAFESHLDNLGRELNPRGMYEKLCREFNRLVAMDNYAGILKVFNQKSMLPVSNVSEPVSYTHLDVYKRQVLEGLQHVALYMDEIVNAECLEVVGACGSTGHYEFGAAVEQTESLGSVFGVFVI